MISVMDSIIHWSVRIKTENNLLDMQLVAADIE